MAGAPRSRTPDSTNYVEYEEYVDFQLDKTRAVVKRTDILTTLMALAVGVIGYLLTFVVFDQWIIEGGFGYASRIVLLSVVGAAVVGMLGWRVVLPLLRHVHPLYAARVIELADPELKSNLVNFVDVKLANSESAPVVLKSMQKRAAKKLEHIDVEEAVDHRPLLRLAYVLLGVVIVSALYIALSPKNVFVSVRRALLPTSSIAVATKTTIENVDPGDKDVPARTRQLISAEVRGEEAEQAQILFTTADHKYVDEAVKMRRETEGMSKFVGELNGENGKGMLQSLTYRIVAGDARSIDYAINVIQPPSARVDEVHYAFPKYTELTEKTSSGGDIEGWEGTIVTIKATANMKVASARIVLTDSDNKSEKGEEISMHVTDGTLLSGTWKLEFRSDGTAPRYYHIRVRTDNQKKDEIDSDPTQYSLRIRADRGPEVVVLDPTADLTKPANGIIPLVVQASDPDFKVRSVILRATRGGDSLFNQDVKLFEDELPARSVTGKYNFRLEPLRLNPGERIQFWIEAKDNKHPTANRTNTTPINVTIDKPVSPEEVQKQLAKDEQNQQDQLARAENANNPDRPDQEQPEPRAGDQSEEQAQLRKDRSEPGAAQKKDKVLDETRNDQDDNGDRKRGKDSPDQQGKPFDNDEALRRLLKKERSPEPDDQNPEEKQEGKQGDKQESQDSPDENRADRSQQEQGEGADQKGRSQSKNQQPKKSDQSPSDRGQQGKNTSDGQREGSQQKQGEDDSESNAGKGAENSKKKNSQTKPKSKSGAEEGEPGKEQADKPQAGDNTKKPGNEDQNSSGDEAKPGAKKADTKTGDKKADPSQDGAGQKSNKDDPSQKNGKKDKPNGNDADQPQPADANPGKKDDSQKKGVTKNQPKNGEGEQDPAQQDGGADQPKDKGDKKAAPKNDGSDSANGDEPKTGDPSEQKKPGDKEGGSGDENEAANGEKDPQPKNKEQGGAGSKPADKTDAGEGAKDDQQSGGTPGQSDKDEGGQESDDQGQGGSKAPKNANGPKKPGGDSKANGPEKPAVDDGTAKDKQATGDEAGEAEGDEGQGDRERPRAGDNVKKKEGSKPGSKKAGTGDDSQRQKANPKRDDEGAEGGTDDAEHADRAPDGKKGRENPGKLDELPSEKGVKRRDGDSEKRPGQPPDVGNQPMKDTGREKGQKSENPDAGEQGGGAASDEGDKGANKDGPGDKSDAPGNTDTADEKTGQPGSKEKGKGSATKPSEDGKGQEQEAGGDNPGDKGAGQKRQKGQKSAAGKQGQGDEADESADGKDSGQSGGKQGGKHGGKSSGESGKDSGNDAGTQPGNGKSSQPGKPGTGQQKSGGGLSSNPGQGNQPGAGEPQDALRDDKNEPRESSEPTAAEQEAINLENAKKATNLVLKRLKSQLERGEVDQEMMDEMGWKGKQDVEKFVRYLEDNLQQNADDNSPEAEARRLQFEVTLRTLEVGSETQRRNGSVGQERAIQQIGGKNVPPPREYQKIWESYTRSLSKQGEKKAPEKNDAKSTKSADKAKADQTKEPGAK